MMMAFGIFGLATAGAAGVFAYKRRGLFSPATILAIGAATCFAGGLVANAFSL